MSDIFDEVENDLRSQKLHQFWKENGNWVIGGAIGAVLLTGAMSLWQSWDYNRDLKATAALVRAISSGDTGALETFAAKADKQHAALARLRAAEEYLAQGQTEKALALYDAVAATRGLDALWRDLARLHAASLRLDTANPEKLSATLAPLAKSPWRYTALELQALLAARAGKPAEATGLLDKIAQDPQAPEDARRRALSLRALYAAEAGKS